MGSKMQNAPVFLALAQVVFNRILALDTYAPTIQDNLRKHGFPDVQKGVVNTFNLTMDGGANTFRNDPPISTLTQYLFFDINKTSGFVLSQDGLSYVTNHYDVFETFIDKFIGVLEIVNKVVELSYVERVGLRYLDAVLPKAGDRLDIYLNACVHGLHGKALSQGATLSHSLSETVFQIEGIQITSRCIIRHGQLVYPPDLIPPLIGLASRFSGTHDYHATLDTDGSMAGRMAFSTIDVRERLGKIHTQIGAAFKSMVTDYALEIWA